MARDMTIKIDGIEGESVVDGHKNEIDVYGFDFGATQTGAGHISSGGGAAKADVKDLTIIKRLDKASPLLLSHCLTGKHIKEVTLFVRKVGGKAIDYYKITMSKVIITGVSTGSVEVPESIKGASDMIGESVSLNFAEVTVEYTPQKEDGSAMAKISQKYLVAEGKAG